MRVLPGVLVGLVAAGCGLSLAIDVGDGGAEADGATTGPTSTTPPKPTTTAPVEPDATPLPDASTEDADATFDAADATVVRDPAKVTVAYALGKNRIMYVFDVTTKTFAAQKSDGCPSGEETAVMETGEVYATSADSRELYRWSSATGCTKIKDGVDYPFALGTAIIAGKEELVGFRDADYQKVDTTNGNVTRITQNALGTLRPSGDLTRIGGKTYLSVQSRANSDCGEGGDCIVEVSPTTGRPDLATIKQYGGQTLYGLAQAQAKLLVFAGTNVHQITPGAASLGAPIASFPGDAGFTGAGAAAAAP